ncbi:MAG: histidine--tRNA ligase [Brevinematales bacterium]|nr:histidine--tRNA ligase [Brevinematales bacterium]
MEAQYSRLRGFSDIYGDDLYYFEVVENTFRKYAKIYGFEEIKLPILERTELFVRGIGEASDIVRKEMFSFDDRGGRNVTMRPEGTACVVRAFLENNFLNDPKYHKLFYSGPMFRAERPQAGRLRQFHQVGVEWFGVDDPIIDFEVMSLLWDFLVEVGIYHRVEIILNSVGCEVCNPSYRVKLQSFFDLHYEEFCDDCKERRKKNILRVFDCKNHSCQLMLKDAPKVKDNLCNVCQYHFDELIRLVSAHNIPFQMDSNLVRGLDYYTRNVFEVRYKGIGAQNAIAGGGRYNNLVSEFGGPKTPGFGFALGVERTILALKDNVEPKKDLSVAVVSVSRNELEFAIKVARIFREKGIRTHLLSYAGGIGKQFKIADKIGVAFTVIIGEEEVRYNRVSVKNMRTGEQFSSQIDEIFGLIFQ